MMLLKCCVQYVSKFGKLGNGHRIRKGQFSFQSQRKAMPKNVQIIYNCTHFPCQQDYIQNPSNYTSKVLELRNSTCTSWIQKWQRIQISKCHHLLNQRKSKRIPENIYFCFSDYAEDFDCVDYNKPWNILKDMEIPDHVTCLLRNLYPRKEAIVRTLHGTMDLFQNGKGVVKAVYQHPGFIPL